MSVGAYAGLAIGAFLLGSIPFGVVISRLFYHRDIRQSGSGNIGAMNALRTLGKTGAVSVLILDAAKGVVPALLVVLFLHDTHAAAIVAACAVLGHCFSPWLNFKGGKGVATSFGAIFALSWPSGVASICGWLVGALSTTYSSVGSMLAHVVAPIALWYFTRDAWLTGYGVFAAILVFYTHRENVARIRAGRESGIPFLRRRRAPD
ncbi:MAG TPA: glycerol-3-phosphate 1-O-acyltransferase PlsY [Candidatus Baltobacteraceae bacterium]|nr:glycerol-3-phosphate 1-O-acyltransferase PlsY [Candidatus Baltobacteraceae bacterium]